MSTSYQKICVDVISPVKLREMSHPQRYQPTDDRLSPEVARAIAPIRSIWANGSRLRVSFMGGTQGERDKDEQVAKEWIKHANLILELGNLPQAEVRVGFVQDGRSWSYVGTDNLNIPRHASTMNFGWPLEEGTILHEFGHAVGLAHEHQNPAGGIQWNEAVVIRELSGPPNFWDEETIRSNVIEKYSQDQIRGTGFDRD